METGARGWGWIGRLKPRTFDRVLVVVLLLLGTTGIVDLLYRRVLPPTVPGGLVGALVAGLGPLLLQVVPLLWRRSHPRIILLLIAGAFGARLLLDFNAGLAGLGLLVAPPAGGGSFHIRVGADNRARRRGIFQRTVRTS